MSLQRHQSLNALALSATLHCLSAGVVAFPVNRRLISRGKGHAVVHAD